MRSILVSFFFSATCIVAFAQSDNQPAPSENRNYLQNRYVLERFSNMDQLQGGTMQTVPMAPPGVIGSDFLNERFQETFFILNDSSFYKSYAQYFVNRNEFDIRTTQGIKVLKGDMVRSFVWKDSISKRPSYYVNARYYLNEGSTPGSGFLEILSEGAIGLFRQVEMIFKEADYHVALNVGSRDHEWIRKVKLYYVLGTAYYPLPAKRKLQSVFPDHKDDIERFIKVNALDLSREDHLQALFNYYNSL